MTIEDILKFPEGKTLEYKENSDDHHNILKTIVAFARVGRIEIIKMTKVGFVIDNVPYP